MRCGVRELPPDPDVAAPSGATTLPPLGRRATWIGSGRTGVDRRRSGSMSSRAVFRLRRALPPVRDGLRPSRSQHEAGCRHQDDRTSWYAAPTGRDREVRYRLCELSSPSNIPKTFGSDGAGVAQLVERQPSKLHVAGSSPVSRSNPPDSYESAACPCAVVASSVIGPSGSRPTISPRASSTTMTAAS